MEVILVGGSWVRGSLCVLGFGPILGGVIRVFNNAVVLASNINSYRLDAFVDVCANEYVVGLFWCGVL